MDDEEGEEYVGEEYVGEEYTGEEYAGEEPESGEGVCGEKCWCVGVLGGWSGAESMVGRCGRRQGGNRDRQRSTSHMLTRDITRRRRHNCMREPTVQNDLSSVAKYSSNA